MGGHKYDNSTDKQDAGRTSQRKKQKNKTNELRKAGGPERGMSLDTKVHIAAVAQGEDDADMRQQDREFATITQRSELAKSLMNFKMQQATLETSSVLKMVYMNEANVHAKTIEELSEDLKSIGGAKRKKNEINDAGGDAHGGDAPPPREHLRGGLRAYADTAFFTDTLLDEIQFDDDHDDTEKNGRGRHRGGQRRQRYQERRRPRWALTR